MSLPVFSLNNDVDTHNYDVDTHNYDVDTKNNDVDTKCRVQQSVVYCCYV